MTPYSADRERALYLAHTGADENWHAVCRKMVFDGWGVEIFNEPAFTEEIDLICNRERGLKAAVNRSPPTQINSNDRGAERP